jgi:hypothetical protein
MIAAPYYSSLFRGNKYIACHAFGATTVGNEEFVDWFCKNVNEHYRIECEDDIIPLIPIGDTFKHIPNCLRISDEYFTNNDDFTRDYVEFAKYLASHHDVCKSFVDLHSCKRYLDILHKAYRYSTISVMDSNNYWDSESVDLFTIDNTINDDDPDKSTTMSWQ